MKACDIDLFPRMSRTNAAIDQERDACTASATYVWRLVVSGGRAEFFFCTRHARAFARLFVRELKRIKP